MSIAVQRLQRHEAGGHVPPLEDYDDASPGWRETEHRARLVGTASVAGFWEGDPGWVRIDNWPFNEVCVLLAGRVAIEDVHGERFEFGAGEGFVIPAGFRGIWHTLEPSEKYFVGVVANGVTGLIVPGAGAP